MVQQTQIQNIRFHITQFLKKEYWQNPDISTVDFKDSIVFQKQIFMALIPFGLVKFATFIHDTDSKLDQVTQRPPHIHAIVEFEKKKHFNIEALALGLEP